MAVKKWNITKLTLPVRHFFKIPTLNFLEIGQIFLLLTLGHRQTDRLTDRQRDRQAKSRAWLDMKHLVFKECIKTDKIERHAPAAFALLLPSDAKFRRSIINSSKQTIKI
jgi:hypothetical protein